MKNLSLKHVRYAAETVLAYVLYGFFWVLPVETASTLGGLMMKKIGPRTKMDNVARQNLRRAFPEKSMDDIEAIVAGMWDNLGRVLAEYPHLRRIGRTMEVVGHQYLDAVRDSGKPAIFFAAHLANWEVNVLSARRQGLDVHLVYRKPNNPWVDGLLRHARDSGAAGHIRKGAAGARDILSVIKKNGAVGILVDQRLSEGKAVPFFGHPAMTPTVPAVFALKYGCSLYPSRVERVKGARFRVTIYPPMVIPETGDFPENQHKVLLDINGIIEGWVKERPEQWLWVHRRWEKN